MIIDISAYNGDINFNELFANNDIQRVILRATVSSGAPDSKLAKNVDGILKANKDIPMDCYKFTYATDYASAEMEAIELIFVLRSMNLLNIFERFWLDIEPRQSHIHSKEEANAIIAAYTHVFKSFGLELGIYCNISYLKNIIPDWCHTLPFWVARWNTVLGDTGHFNVYYWQYSDKGELAGINGPVDLSRYVNETIR